MHARRRSRNSGRAATRNARTEGRIEISMATSDPAVIEAKIMNELDTQGLVRTAVEGAEWLRPRVETLLAGRSDLDVDAVVAALAARVRKVVDNDAALAQKARERVAPNMDDVHRPR
jgi:hypothetical protein